VSGCSPTRCRRWWTSPRGRSSRRRRSAAGVAVELLSGLGKLDGRLVLMLDLDRVLSPVEAGETAAIAAGAEIALAEGAAQAAEPDAAA